MFLCGIVFIVLGVAFLLTNLGVISGSVFYIIVASVFIVIGLKCLLKRKGGHHWCCCEEHKHSGE
ncbi:LiaI-LiaF-like domain-containing protein [Patescibacteria group bacterium]